MSICYDTPCYVIKERKFKENYLDVIDSFSKKWKGLVSCGYSVKTNNRREMLKLAWNNNMYAEVVSTREYNYVKELGFTDSKIIFNGPVKGNAFKQAIFNGARINLDSLQEVIELVEYIKKNRINNYNIGLRLNFDLEKCVPGQTMTGTHVGRFGICWENGDFEKAIDILRENDITIKGIHVHYTTITRSLEVFGAIAEKVAEVITKMELNLEYIDIGGGFFGGMYLAEKPTMEQYSEVITKKLEGLNSAETELVLEPGSAICASVVEYQTKVVAVKEIRGTRIVVLDGTVLHINPFLHDRKPLYHIPKALTERKIVEKQILVGSTCLENDRFMTLTNTKELEKDDCVCFTYCGAYTMSLLSDFIVEKPRIYVE